MPNVRVWMEEESREDDMEEGGVLTVVASAVGSCADE